MSDAAALGYSIVANLGDNRQITAQCFVASDAPLAEINAQIDKVQAVLDRQRAKYSIKDLIEERKQQATTLQRAEDDLARVEGEFKTQQATLNTRLGLLAEEVKQIDDAAYAKGRSGGAVGHEKARRNALVAEQAEIQSAMEKAREERGQHHHNVVISIARFREAVADSDRRIAEFEALIGEE